MQPQTDQGGERVVQHQEHDGIDKMMPLQAIIDSKLPGGRTVCSNDGGNTKHTGERDEEHLTLKYTHVLINIDEIIQSVFIQVKLIEHFY